MKKAHGILGILLFLVLPVWSQEHYTEGPVWVVTLIKVKPNQMDAYLTTLRQSSKPFFDEEKKQGLILDYKVFFKETMENPHDWDICLAVQYKNHAALDGLEAKADAIRDKVLGGKQPAQQLSVKREEMREILSSTILQEVMLK
jgi:hypothetical protein